MSQDFLYLISKEQLNKEFIFENIYPNKNLNYYLCDDLSLETNKTISSKVTTKTAEIKSSKKDDDEWESF